MRGRQAERVAAPLKRHFPLGLIRFEIVQGNLLFFFKVRKQSNLVRRKRQHFPSQCWGQTHVHTCTLARKHLQMAVYWRPSLLFIEVGGPETGVLPSLHPESWTSTAVSSSGIGRCLMSDGWFLFAGMCLRAVWSPGEGSAWFLFPGLFLSAAGPWSSELGSGPWDPWAPFPMVRASKFISAPLLVAPEIRASRHNPRE